MDGHRARVTSELAVGVTETAFRADDGARGASVLRHRCRDCRAANALQAARVASVDPLVDYDFVVDTGARQLDGVAYFSAYCEGPPGAAHGGMIAAMLDQAMGVCVIAASGPCVTLHLECDYRKFLPSDSEVRVRCHVERSDGRKHWLVGEITSLDGETVHATGKTLYLEIRKKQ